jgi:hypothetical protein
MIVTGFPSSMISRAACRLSAKSRHSAKPQLTLALPLHDRNGANRIRRGAIDYFSTDSEVDQRVPRFIHQAINTSRLEKNARFLTKHLFIFT